jgi:lauroyl/myristoyl acyltransferase
MGQTAAHKFTIPRNPQTANFKRTQVELGMGEWILLIWEEPRGALERVFANFFAQTGKMTNSSPPKKTL